MAEPRLARYFYCLKSTFNFDYISLSLSPTLYKSVLRLSDYSTHSIDPILDSVVLSPTTSTSFGSSQSDSDVIEDLSGIPLYLICSFPDCILGRRDLITSWR